MSTIPTALRWVPTHLTPELPLSTFDLTWSADGGVVCSGFYPEELSPPEKGIRLAFDDVHALMSFDEYSDVLEITNIELPTLAVPVLYGGLWPFVKLVGSPWLLEVAMRNGAIDPGDYRHWVIISRNRTLHIMANQNSLPTFLGWLS